MKQVFALETLLYPYYKFAEHSIGQKFFTFTLCQPYIYIDIDMDFLEKP